MQENYEMKDMHLPKTQLHSGSNLFAANQVKEPRRNERLRLLEE